MNAWWTTSVTINRALGGQDSEPLCSRVYRQPPSLWRSAFMALMEGRTILDLAEGLQLRRCRVMGANRIELSGFTDTMRQRLTAYGLFHEIISWKLHFFVPADTNGVSILTKLLDTYPVARISEREAA